MSDQNRKKSKIVTEIVALTAGIIGCLGYLTNITLLLAGIFLGFIAVILAANLKKGIFRKRVLAEIIAFIAIVVIFFSCGKETVYDLTEEEKEWLHKCYDNKYDEERIEEGTLLPSQYRYVEMSREGLEFLEEKYPGYEFKITYLDPRWDMQAFGVREKTTDYPFSMYISKNEDGTLEIKDNFYAYLFEDKYEAYVEEQIKEKIENVVKVNLYISSVEGREYDSSMTVDDIVSGKLEVHATIHINIAAKGMTEEECMENVKLVEQSIKEVGVSGIYDIFYRDMTEEEILSTDEYEKAIYAPIIHFFNGEVEIY